MVVVLGGGSCHSYHCILNMPRREIIAYSIEFELRSAVLCEVGRGGRGLNPTRGSHVFYVKNGQRQVIRQAVPASHSGVWNCHW